jgi:hypothetical protein
MKAVVKFGIWMLAIIAVFAGSLVLAYMVSPVLGGVFLFAGTFAVQRTQETSRKFQNLNRILTN